MADVVYITTEQRADMEHRSVGAIHQERHRGRGPTPYRVGRRLLWRKDEVLDWIANQAVAVVPEPQEAA